MSDVLAASHPSAAAVQRTTEMVGGYPLTSLSPTTGSGTEHKRAKVIQLRKQDVVDSQAVNSAGARQAHNQSFISNDRQKSGGGLHIIGRSPSTKEIVTSGHSKHGPAGQQRAHLETQYADSYAMMVRGRDMHPNSFVPVMQPASLSVHHVTQYSQAMFAQQPLGVQGMHYEGFDYAKTRNYSEDS